MLTPWFPWQQQLGGREDVCVAEVTLPHRMKRKNLVHDEGNDVIDECVLAPHRSCFSRGNE